MARTFTMANSEVKLGFLESLSFTKSFRGLKWRVSGFPEPYSRLFGGGGEIPLHKPFPYSLYHGEDSSILGTNEKFGDPCEGGMTSVIETIGTTSRILGHQVQPNRQKGRLSNGGCLEIKEFFFRW